MNNQAKFTLNEKVQITWGFYRNYIGVLLDHEKDIFTRKRSYLVEIKFKNKIDKRKHCYQVWVPEKWLVLYE